MLARTMENTSIKNNPSFMEKELHSVEMENTPVNTQEITVKNDSAVSDEIPATITEENKFEAIAPMTSITKMEEKLEVILRKRALLKELSNDIATPEEKEISYLHKVLTMTPIP